MFISLRNIEGAVWRLIGTERVWIVLGTGPQLDMALFKACAANANDA